jgi:hypothetical protein
VRGARVRVRRGGVASDECAPSAKLLFMHSESGTPRWSETSWASSGFAVPAMTFISAMPVRARWRWLWVERSGVHSLIAPSSRRPVIGAAARGTGKGALPTVGASWSPLKPDDSDPNRSRAQMGSEEEEEEEEEQGEECVLVIDIGSSSTRCVAYGMDCRPLELRRRRRHAL